MRTIRLTLAAIALVAAAAPAASAGNQCNVFWKPPEPPALVC